MRDKPAHMPDMIRSYAMLRSHDPDGGLYNMTLSRNRELDYMAGANGEA
jgi:hypothetical protein